MTDRRAHTNAAVTETDKISKQTYSSPSFGTSWKIWRELSGFGTGRETHIVGKKTEEKNRRRKRKRRRIND